MKNLIQKTFLLFVIFAFIGFAQMANAADSNKKVSVQKSEIIIVVTGARLRNAPSLKSNVIGSSKIGTVLPVLRKSGNWYQVSTSNGNAAWISGTIVKNFTDSARGIIYQEIADKYLNREKLDFDTGSEVFDFLSKARNDVENKNVQAALGLRRLRILHRTLEVIPFDNARPWNDKEVSIYKDFVVANDSEVAYSEPAGQWFVNSDAFWKLRERYKDSPIADDIAWEAANNPLPGECEGFITCYLPKMTMTYGEYLKIYPSGKYSKKMLAMVTSDLNSMAGNDGSGFEEPIESEFAEFNQNIKELRAIVSKVSHPERQRALNLLNQLAKKYK